MTGQPIAYINARLIDPASGLDTKGALLTLGDQIADLGPGLFAAGVPSGMDVVDCGGHVLCPGLIDMRVFIGEPGAKHRDSLSSAGRAAAAGGVTTFVAMPDTEPPIDDLSVLEFVARRARETASVNILPMAALTKGMQGMEMAELGLLKDAGAIAFGDGRRGVANARVLRRAMSYASAFGVLVIQHVEDPDLARDGAMNEGETATRLGLPGIPALAEILMLQRDLSLAQATGVRYHAAQISCAGAAEILRQAKKHGADVTAGVSIAHLSLNELDIATYRTFFKLSPPLRSEDDRMAMVAALEDGTIDVIVSAHDPQDVESKRQPFAQAAFGAVGLETMLPVALGLYHGGFITLPKLLAAMTSNPARILGLNRGRLAVGLPADLVLFDPDRPAIIDAEKLHSKSKNSPFDQRKVQGRIERTIVSGRCVYTVGD
jgi:dihydroorotase